MRRSNIRAVHGKDYFAIKQTEMPDEIVNRLIDSAGDSKGPRQCKAFVGPSTQCTELVLVSGTDHRTKMSSVVLHDCQASNHSYGSG